MKKKSIIFTLVLIIFLGFNYVFADLVVPNDWFPKNEPTIVTITTDTSAGIMSVFCTILMIVVAGIVHAMILKGKEVEKEKIVLATKKIKVVRSICLAIQGLVLAGYIFSITTYLLILNKIIEAPVYSSMYVDINYAWFRAFALTSLILYWVFRAYLNNTKKLDDEERKMLIYYFGGNGWLAAITAVGGFLVTAVLDIVMTPAYKPVIYLYPTKKQNVKVKLLEKEKITHSYPKYEDEWNVEADVDGTLTDLKTNRKLYSLYYEADYKLKNLDKKVGFCVKGEDTAKFLEEKLEALGLSYKEAEEFIIYWLPKMENNKYNYIYFKVDEEVNEMMNLEITPKPDSLIRILMIFKPLNKQIEVKEQEIVTPNRDGFVAVEWGGSKI